MALPGNGTIPAVYSQRIHLAKQAGMMVLELLKNNLRPRQIMTAKAFHNALTVDMALGCSTNTALHLPAIAAEAGVEFDLHTVNEISSLKPVWNLICIRSMKSVHARPICADLLRQEITICRICTVPAAYQR